MAVLEVSHLRARHGTEGGIFISGGALARTDGARTSVASFLAVGLAADLTNPGAIVETRRRRSQLRHEIRA